METDKLISVFVALLLGIVFLGVLSSSMTEKTDLVSATQTFDLTAALGPSYTTVNETGGYVNETGYVLGNFTAGWVTSGVVVYNATDGVLIDNGTRYLLNDTTGVLTNGTDVVWADVLITYTWTMPTWIDNTYPFYLDNIDSSVTPSLWREDVADCSKETLFTSLKLSAFNSTGDELTMNGCDVGEFYLIDGINEVYFCNNANVNGSATATVTYQYCPDGYVSGWAGTTLNLTAGFYALGVLLVAIAGAYFILRRGGYF